MTFPFAETVTIIRQVQGPSRSKTDGLSHMQTGCAVWPMTSSEVITGQDTVTWDYTVLMPADTDVLSTDVVVCRGTRYAVTGMPGSYASPLTGTSAGLEVHLTTATG